MSHNRNRPKTNSLTHLVKIICIEIFNDKIKLSHFQDIDNQLCELKAKVENLDRKITAFSITTPKTSEINNLKEQMSHLQISIDCLSTYQNVKFGMKDIIDLKTEMENITDKVTKLSEQISDVKITNLHIDTKEAIKKVHNDLLKAGGLWSDDEDELLERELSVAVNAMAANHQRSKGAIKSRLQKMMQYDLSGLDDIKKRRNTSYYHRTGKTLQNICFGYY